MNKPIRIMIDMETTAACAEAGILSMGAVVFDLPFGSRAPTFYEKASLASNEQVGRKIDKATMEWWDKQNLEIRTEAFSGTQAIDDLLDHFRIWCEHIPGVDLNFNCIDNIELWSRGAGFDCEILQHAFYQIFGKYPFDFRKHMCQRTVERLMPEQLKKARSPLSVNLKHHALYDAEMQADMMDIALRNINWTGNAAMPIGHFY